MRAAWIWVGLALALLPPVSADVAGPEVHLKNGFFSPSSLAVAENQRVLFVNDDDRPHTVTSSWDEGKAVNVVLLPGQAVPVTFAHAGTYPLRCVPHSTHDASGDKGMIVSIDVQGAAAPAKHGWSPALLGTAAVGAILVSFGAWRVGRPQPQPRPR